MISLYPSHIPISFPYPYISHIHKSFVIFACCPATCFFIFHFLWRGGGGCVFLVVFWCRYCGCFPPVPRLVCRSVLRSVSPLGSLFVSPFGPFSRFAPRSAFRSASSFRFSVWACRVGGLCGVPFYSALLDRVGVCSFSCFGVVAAMWEACIVDEGGSVDGVAGRLCGAYGVPCGLAWGVSLGEVLGGVWWRLRDMGMMRRMAGRCGREGYGMGEEMMGDSV